MLFSTIIRKTRIKLDPFTQGIIGASAAQSFAKQTKNHMWLAFVVAFLAGGAADLDIFIKIPGDPIGSYLLHRHFTHSLFFIPFGGAITGAMYWLVFARKRYDIRWVIFYTTLGYATHGLLDACTSYGTVLFWPLSNERISWDIVSIIDLWVTVPLIIGATLAAFRKKRIYAILGLVIAIGYLGLGHIQHEKALELQAQIAKFRNHEIIKGRVMPSFMTNRYFNSVYEATTGYLYTDVIHIPLLGWEQPYSGRTARVKAVHAEDILPTLSERQQKDFKKFNWFAGGYLYRQRVPGRVVYVDGRYSQLPGTFQPMWGIEVFPREPDRPAERYHFERVIPRR
jgi:inner membrane protein